MGLFSKKKDPSPKREPAKAAEPDMDDIIFNMKYSAKQLGKLSSKSTKQVEVEKRKCKEMIEKGNQDGARIFAENAIRNEKQALQYLKMQARLDAVASKLQGANQMQNVVSQMGMVTTNLESALQTMDVNQIASVMDKFEKQFEDLGMAEATMDNAVSDTMAGSTPVGEVDMLLQKVADQHQLNLGTAFGNTSVPTGVGAQPAASAAAPQQDDLQARFNKLAGK